MAGEERLRDELRRLEWLAFERKETARNKKILDKVLFILSQLSGGWTYSPGRVYEYQYYQAHGLSLYRRTTGGEHYGSFWTGEYYGPSHEITQVYLQNPGEEQPWKGELVFQADENQRSKERIIQVYKPGNWEVALETLYKLALHFDKLTLQEKRALIPPRWRAGSASPALPPCALQQKIESLRRRFGLK